MASAAAAASEEPLAAAMLRAGGPLPAHHPAALVALLAAGNRSAVATALRLAMQCKQNQVLLTTQHEPASHWTFVESGCRGHVICINVGCMHVRTVEARLPGCGLTQRESDSKALPFMA